MAVQLCHVTLPDGVTELLGVSASEATGVNGKITFTPVLNDVVGTGGGLGVPAQVDTFVKDGQWVDADEMPGAWFVRPDSTDATFVYSAKVDLGYRAGGGNAVRAFHIAVPAAGTAVLDEIRAQPGPPHTWITKGETGPAPEIVDGTIATGAPGSAVALTFTETSPGVYRADGSVPQGLPGAQTTDASLLTSGTLALGRLPDLTSAPAVAGKVKKGELVFNVRDYGAVGNGVADDTAAFQACVDAVLGGPSDAARPISGRIAKGPMYIPWGEYKITAPIKIYASMGFCMYGAGEETLIFASGNLPNMFDVNGAYYPIFANFTMLGRTPTDTADTALQIEWDPAVTSRSTTGAWIERVNIRNLKFKVGIGVGTLNPGKQADNTSFHHCSVVGFWATGEATWYQSAYKSGNGTFSNVLNHNFYMCTASAVRWAHHANAISGYNIYGGSVGGNDTDFNLAIGSANSINGVRSESSARFITTGISSANVQLSIRDCMFQTAVGAADNRFIQWGYPGSLIIDNFFFAAALATPTIYVTGNAARNAAVIVRGGASRADPSTYVASAGASGPFTASFDGYQQTNSGGQTDNTFNRVLTTRAGVLSTAPAVTTQTTSYALSSLTDDVVVFNGASLTATLPDPATVTAGRSFRVKNVNSASLSVVSAGTSKTIDGAASQTLTQWATARYASDGTQWLTA